MKTFLTCFCALTISLYYFSNSKPAIQYDDKIRLREVFRIEKEFGENIWKGYTTPPFAIVLIYDDYEFLINHPKPSNDFIFLENDPILKTPVYYRKRVFNKHFLATFPAVGGVTCVVVGSPKNTNKTTTEWIVTLLHERFHQYQYTSKNYYQDALNLGISNGDTTGMWQLNYPFPYKNEKVVQFYDTYTSALKAAVDHISHKDFDSYFRQFLKARKSLKQNISTNDYIYFSFQLYQEGIARYTEYAFLDAMKDFSPSKELKKIADFEPFSLYKKRFYKKHLNNVVNLKLDQIKRVCFYDAGFAEALLINKVNSTWRDRYLLDKFDIEKFYP